MNMWFLTDVRESDLDPLCVVLLFLCVPDALFDPLISKRWFWRIPSEYEIPARRRRRRDLLIHLGLRSRDLASIRSHLASFGVENGP